MLLHHMVKCAGTVLHQKKPSLTQGKCETHSEHRGCHRCLYSSWLVLRSARMGLEAPPTTPFESPPIYFHYSWPRAPTSLFMVARLTNPIAQGFKFFRVEQQQDRQSSFFLMLKTSYSITLTLCMIKVSLSTRRKDRERQWRSRDIKICPIMQIFYYKFIIIFRKKHSAIPMIWT